MMVWAQVEELQVYVRCGVSDEERALPQLLFVSLKYSYEAGSNDDLSGVVDYGDLIEGVAERLEREEFKLLETGASRVGGYVLERFPEVREVVVEVTKPGLPIQRSLAGVTIRSRFVR